MACRGRGDGSHAHMDRGWAWVVAMAVMSYNMLIGGTFKSYGLLYAEFIHWFPEGPAAVGLISLMFGVAGIVSAPIGGRLSDSVSPRKMVFVGGLVISASFALTSLAQNLITAIMTFGVLAGSSIGIIDGPILSFIGRYFKRKQNLASGIAWMGSSVGNMALAPLFSYMISVYGIRGTLILLGGIWTHTCVIALLLRPPKPAQQPLTTIAGQKAGEVLVNGTQQSDIIPTGDGLNAMQSASQNEHSADAGGLCKERELSGSIPLLNGTQSTLNKTIVLEDDTKDLSQGSMTCLNVIYDDTKVPEIQNELNAILDVPNVQNPAPEIQIQTFVNNTQQVDPTEEGLSLQGDDCMSDREEKSTYFQFLCNADMWRVVMTLGCGFYGYYTPIICIPVWGEELSLSHYQVAALLSVVGAVEIFSRVLLGYMADLPWVSISVLLTVSYIIMGIAGQVIVLVPSFAALMVYMVVHGVFGGTAHVLMASLLFRTTSMRWFGSATGLAVVQIHLSASIASTSAGLMKEATGSYRHIIQVSSGIYLLGVVIFNTGQILTRLKSRSRSPSSC